MNSQPLVLPLVCLLPLQVGMETVMSVAQLQVVLLSFNQRVPFLPLAVALMSSSVEFLRKSLWLMRNAQLMRSSILSLVSLYPGMMLSGLDA